MQQLPTIQSLWIGDRLSTMERLCIASFLHHGHSFHLYTYDHVENVPEGTIIKDANEILPYNLVFKCKYGSYAAFADIFRYKLLFKKGSYWVDTDIICLQPFSDDTEYIFASERLEQPSSDNQIHITNCLIKAPRGSAIMEYCYKEASSQEHDKLEWGEIGPKLIQEAVNKFGINTYVADPQEFCPVNWWEWNRFIDPSIVKSVLTGSKAVHLWNEMWRQNNIDKSAEFDEHSIYEWLKKKYLRFDQNIESILAKENSHVYPDKNAIKKQKDMNNKDLIVSICVMSYNLEKYIAEALDSILMQKVNFTYNIVVGEDCSTDRTRQILQEYVEKYPNIFKVILHQNNMGVLANFAATLKECEGKYIALLDGDDYWTDPLKLQKQVDFLDSNKEYSMVFHNIDFHDETKNGVTVKPFNSEEKSREYTYDEITRTWSVGTCSVLCINNKQYRYIENNLWFPVQDLPFYLCCASMGKIYYISDTMSVYRRLLSGSMNTKEFRGIQIHLDFVKYLNVLYNDFNKFLTKETLNRTVSSHYLYAAQKSKKNGNEKDYLQYLALAMIQDPEFIYEKEIQTAHKKLEDKINQQQKTINNRENTIKGKESLINKLQAQLKENITFLSLLKNSIKKFKPYSNIKTHNSHKDQNNETK